MDAHRQLALTAMQAMVAEAAGDFMNAAKIPMPVAIVPGALPGIARETVPAEALHLHVDVDMAWTIGDFVPEHDCSAYYDPSSAWYNVFYGAYGLRSYKPDGAAWGFHPDGSPDFDEFFRISEIDYDFLTAGQFGCPPSKMCFAVQVTESGTARGWSFAEVTATIPSGLHDLATTLGNPAAYVIYGVPSPTFLAGGHAPYEQVKMRGTLFLRQVTPPPLPITLAWGALCPDTPDGRGRELLATIIDAMGRDYLGS
jgi:hypothetical protein